VALRGGRPGPLGWSHLWDEEYEGEQVAVNGTRHLRFLLDEVTPSLQSTV